MAKKVFIGVGHGGNDPGESYAGLIEKDINFVMALACKEELEHHGIIVRMSRTVDENDPVSQEVSECNQFNPDIALDCHNNSGKGDGFEIFYWPGSSDGLKLAKLIESEVKAIGQNSRGLKSGKHLRFINSTKCTSVLTEGFFLDNNVDNKIGDTVAEQKAFGKAYVKGILKYFGIAYKPVSQSSNSSNKVYRVQVGAFKDSNNADKLAKELKEKGYDAYVK